MEENRRSANALSPRLQRIAALQHAHAAADERGRVRHHAQDADGWRERRLQTLLRPACRDGNQRLAAQRVSVLRQHGRADMRLDRQQDDIRTSDQLRRARAGNNAQLIAEPLQLFPADVKRQHILRLHHAAAQRPAQDRLPHIPNANKPSFITNNLSIGLSVAYHICYSDAMLVQRLQNTSIISDGAAPKLSNDFMENFSLKLSDSFFCKIEK